MWILENLAVLVVALTAGALVQGDRVPPPKGSHSAVIRGCVHGSSLKAIHSDTDPGDETFHLRMSKGIAKALKEYEGHQVELTGFVKDTDRMMGGAKSKNITSKTKITVGGSEDRNEGGVPDARELQVTSFRDVAPTCSR
jgi:hypothetical protein